MTSNHKLNEQHKKRILMRAEKRRLFENQQSWKYSEVDEEIRRLVESLAKVNGIPVILFYRNNLTWTLLTTLEVVSFHDNSLHSSNLNLINKEIEICSQSQLQGNRKVKTESEFFEIINTGSIIWAPPGAELFALLGILMMFPLSEP